MSDEEDEGRIPMPTTSSDALLGSPQAKPATRRRATSELTVQDDVGEIQTGVNLEKMEQVERINVLVVGQPATGKTGLVKLFLETAPLSLLAGGLSDSRIHQENPSEGHGRLGDNLDATALLARCAEFASFTSFCPTTALSTLVIPVKIQNSADGSQETKTRIFSFIDTPGLHLHLPHEREQVLDSVFNRITEGFQNGLKADNETSTRDSHIHLCLYLLDPNSLVPPETHHLMHPELYSSSLAPARQRLHQATLPTATTSHLLLAGMPSRFSSPNDPTSASTTRHYDSDRTSPHGQISILSEEKAVIERIARRVPVLPVIVRADELTEIRLEATKECVKREMKDVTEDLVKYVLEDSRTSGSVDEPMTGTPLQRLDMTVPAVMLPESYHHGDGAAPATARLSHGSYVERLRTGADEEQVGQHPTDGPSIQKRRGEFLRTYRWGVIDVLDTKNSDFASLRAALLHPRIHELRDLVAERYLPAYLADAHAPQASKETVPRHRQEPSSGSSFVGPYSPQSLAHTPGLPPSPTAPFPQFTSSRSQPSLSLNTTRPTRVTSAEEPSRVVSPGLVTPSARSYPSRGSIQFAVPYSFQSSAPLSSGQPTPSPSGFPSGPSTVPIRWADQTTPLSRRGSGKKVQVSDADASTPVLTAPASNPVYLGPTTGKYPPGVQEVYNREQLASSSAPTLAQGAPQAASPTAPSAGSQYPMKSRTGRKIAVACNFCRSRKLKCDGVRPLCGQCQRRGVQCEYELMVKKRGMGKMALSMPALDPADSGDGGSVTSGPSSTRRPPSNVETTRELPSGSKQIQWRIDLRGSNPAPLITTANPSANLSRSGIDVMQPQSPQGADLQAVLLAEIPSRGYACQFCRTRKTRCDGTLPKCSNCAKRNQPCVYPPSYFHAASASGEQIAFTTSSPTASNDDQQSPADPLQSGSNPTAAPNPTFRPGTGGTSGISLPPISSLPLGPSLRDQPSSSSQHTSLMSTSYWPPRAGNASGPLLPPRQSAPISPLSTTRPFPPYARSADRSADSRLATSSSRTSALTRPPLLIPTSPTSAAPHPSASNISPLTLAQSTPFVVPLPRRDSGEQPGHGGLMRRPSTADSASQSHAWRDRSSFSSTSTRGGGSFGIGGERKRKASGSEGAQENEEEEDGAAPSPPKRRRVSGEGFPSAGERRSSKDETRK